MAEPKKIIIAIPCRDEIKAAAFTALAPFVAQSFHWWKKTHGEDALASIMVIPQMHVVGARIFVMEQAIKHEVDYVLWVDDDMTPPIDMLERLYGTMVKEKAALVGGLCYRRGEPYGPCAFTLEFNKKKNHNCWMKRLPERIEEAAATGFAALLMDMAQARDVWDLSKGAPFAFLNNCGEDAYYCSLAKKLGHRILIDTSIVPGHVGHFVYDATTFENLLAHRPDLQECFETGA